MHRCASSYLVSPCLQHISVILLVELLLLLLLERQPLVVRQAARLTQPPPHQWHRLLHWQYSFRLLRRCSWRVNCLFWLPFLQTQRNFRIRDRVICKNLSHFHQHTFFATLLFVVGRATKRFIAMFFDFQIIFGVDLFEMIQCFNRAICRRCWFCCGCQFIHENSGARRLRCACLTRWWCYLAGGQLTL